ncbi:MAG: hypothetical protein ACRD2Z_17440 [Thermoanaerobaculia bacterium]
MRCLVVASLVGSLLAGCAPQEPAPRAADAERGEAGTPAILEVRHLEPPAAPGALAPRLTADATRVWLSWLEPDAEGHRFLTASLDPATGRFGEPAEIAAGDDFFANWADLPAVVPAGGGRLLAHRLARLGDSVYAYGVELAVSGDGGRSWQPAGLLHADGSPQEHGFVSWTRDPSDGAAPAVAAWLDGRAMNEGGPMQLRAASVPSSGRPADETLLDPRVCECCATGAAWTAEGPIVVYRDRGEDEIRDIWRVRWRDGRWSEPAPVAADGWRIAGCPVNGPQVAADGERVAVAWFTAAAGQPRVLAAFSDDAGETFAPPVTVDDGQPIGRVDLVLDGDAALVTWLGSSADSAAILVRRVGRDGRTGPVHVLAASGHERAAGFPRMARVGAHVVWTWLEPGDPARLVAAAAPLAEVAPLGG